MRISDWSSDVCSSDLTVPPEKRPLGTSGAVTPLALPAIHDRMRSSRKGSRDRCTRRSGGRCSGEDAGKPMSAFRLLAAGLIVAAFASPARAAAPGICAEGAGAMAMHLYSVAVARLDACLALEEPNGRGH